VSSQYRFRAKDWKGNTVKGFFEAADTVEAVNYLHARNLVPLELRKDTYLNTLRRFFVPNFLKVIGMRQSSSRDLMIFCRQLSTMLQAGIPLLHALHVLAGQVEKPAFRLNLKAAADALEQGDTLFDAFQARRGFFPPLLTNMIAAGEAGGILDTVMEKMADHYEKQHDLEAKIRSATAYPIFITAVAFTVMMVMVTVVLPQFAGVFNSIGMELPYFSRLLLTVGEAARIYWPLALLLLVLFSLFLAFSSRSEMGKKYLDLIRLRLPLFGPIYKHTLSAHFARTLGTLLAGGVTLHDSLLLSGKVVGSPAIADSIQELSESISRGESMAAAMRNINCFPPLLSEMVQVGEETGSLDYTLQKTALFYEREVSYTVERLSSILEPALLLLVGLFIGLLVFSILSPMYQVFQMI
jgi:type IV pilus assembly protein PilC